MVSLNEIFSDVWDKFVTLHKVRPVVDTEIRKVIKCGDTSEGYALYLCKECNQVRFVPFRCRSRACSTCGYQLSKYRAEKVQGKLINAKHRHIVFTIAEELRPYFQKDRKLLDILFQSSASTISQWLKSKNKSKQFETGMIATLHTFGRDLKWNPHIHMLVAMCAVSNKPKPLYNFKPCINIPFIPFAMLRKRFMTTLLFNLKPYIPKQLIDFLYRNYKLGFYVNAPDKQMNLQQVVGYILRYISRPVIAKSRILKYQNQLVTFCYNDHQTNKYIEETIPVFEFVKKVIIHIPPKHFNMIRHYGLYAKKHRLNLYQKTIPKHIQRYINLWHMRIIAAFNYNPLKCVCGNIMQLDHIYNPRSPTRKIYGNFRNQRKIYA